MTTADEDILYHKHKIDDINAEILELRRRRKIHEYERDKAQRRKLNEMGEKIFSKRGTMIPIIRFCVECGEIATFSRQMIDEPEVVFLCSEHNTIMEEFFNSVDSELSNDLTKVKEVIGEFDLNELVWKYKIRNNL